MVETAIMIEGQDGLNWARWQRIAQVVEALGFAGLYRSDHFTNSSGINKDSLELWVSLTWLASHTQRIAFGSLVTPVSFRDPVFTARTAMQVDDLSGGRLELGVGAGWQEREHNAFGYDLLDVPHRFQRYQEGLEVLTRLMKHGDEPVDFNGQYYQLRGAQLLPRPNRPGGPPLVIGGNGEQRTLPLVVRYADQWNAVDLPAERVKALNARLDEMLRAAGRDARSVRRTLMTSLAFGEDKNALQARLGGRDPQSMRERGALVGTPVEIRGQLHALEEAGVQRVMLRWADMDDLDGLEGLAKAMGN